jgi:hypothetical protein
MSLCAAQGTAPNERRGGNPGTLRSALPLYGYAAAERPNTCSEGGCQGFFTVFQAPFARLCRSGALRRLSAWR